MCIRDSTFPESLPVPEVEGASLTYPQVYPGVDLVLTATSSTFSQVLVIKDRSAAANPKVRTVRVKTSVTGGAVRAGKDGGYAVADSAGKEVLIGAAPLAWDSSGAPNGTPGQGTDCLLYTSRCV